MALLDPDPAMPTLRAAVEGHRDAIRAAVERHHGRRVRLFGSAARGEFDPELSDLDFFVEFQDLGWKGSFKRFMGLKLAFEALFARPVDLVELQSVVNRYFVEVATRHRQRLYAA